MVEATSELARSESEQTYVRKDFYESFPVAQSKEADHPATLALPTTASDRVENTETPLLVSENTGPSSDAPDLFSEKHDTEALPADDATDLDRLETAIYKSMKEIKEKISVLGLEQERIASQLMIYKDQLAGYEKQLEISKILQSKG